jgi:hypothetical protein
MVPKSSPFHDPQFEVALKKVALQSGVVTPSQVGLDLPKPKKGEQPALKMKTPTTPGGGKTPTKKKGQPQQGRPKNSKDTKKRKEKTFKPKSKAVVEVWAKAAQSAIAEVLNPGILEQFGKANMRSLTSAEQDKAEQIKFGVLTHLPACGIVDEETIMAALEDGSPLKEVIETYSIMAREVASEIDRALTLDEQRQVQVCAYTNVMGE